MIYHLFDEDHHTISQPDTPAVRPRSLVVGIHIAQGKESRQGNTPVGHNKSNDTLKKMNTDEEAEKGVLAKAGLVQDFPPRSVGCCIWWVLGFVFCTTTAVLVWSRLRL